MGPDLLDILGREGALPEHLLDGARPQVEAGEDRPLPGRDVQWAGRGEATAEFTPRPLPATVAGHLLLPELGVPRPHGSPTPSGRLFLARGAPGVADDDRDAVDAALGFPPVAGAAVLHVHTTGGGSRFVVDDQVLTAAEFAGRVASLGLPAGQPVILVACDAVAAAGELAGLLDAPVIAADASAWTTPDGRVVAAQAGVDDQSRAVLEAGRGDWVLVAPDGRRSGGLGRDLLDVLRSEALPSDLLIEPRQPRVAGSEGQPRPTRNVRWAADPLSGLTALGKRSRGPEGEAQGGDEAGPSQPDKRPRVAGPSGATALGKRSRGEEERDAEAGPRQRPRLAEQPGGPGAVFAAGGADPVRRAVAYLSGDPAADLDAGQLAEVVKALVSGLAVVPRPQALALRLLEAADDSVLGKMLPATRGWRGR